MDAQSVLSLATGLLGLAGLIWTAIRFWRHDPATVDRVRDAAVTRRRFLVTWLLLAALAFGVGLTLWLTIHTAADQTDLAQASADKANRTADDTLGYLKGDNGLPGVPGADGKNGTPGLPGSAGKPGATGPPGPPGDKGPAGPAGPTGPTGPAGSSGVAGIPGVTPAAVPGPQGAKGATGATGATGAKGATGTQGPAGPAGPAGANGTPGVTSTATAVGSSANNTATMKVANATCPAGMRVTGGGFAIVPSDPGLIATATGPVGTNGWSATIEQLSLPPGTVWQVLVFAQCV